MGLQLPFAALLALTGIAASEPQPVLTPPLAAALPLPPKPGESEILELEVERYQRLTVPVTIGGAGPYRFMIDTGAQSTVISRDLADRLALRDRRSAQLIGMVSSAPVETATIDNFALGSRSFLIQAAALVDPVNIGGSDGILGVDSLQQQRVLLDFENNRIAVADARQLGGNSGFEIVVRARQRLGQLILTRAQLDGFEVDVIVDTGAQISVGNAALLAKLRSASVGESELLDINGQDKRGEIKLGKRLSFGRAKIENLPIAFIESPAFAALGLAEKPALMLGMQQLRLFRRVAIDFQTNKVMFDLPKETALRRSTGRTGAPQ